MIKLGIDLATRKIGVCALSEKNDLIFNETIMLVEYSEERLLDNVKRLGLEVHNIIEKLGGSDILLGIELSNFNNPKLTQRFSFYSGVIVSELGGHDINAKVKMFNSNAWQYKLGLSPQAPREARKKASFDFTYSKTGIKMSEDEADAYCIAYFLNEIETTEQSEKRIKMERATKYQRQAALYRKEKQINKVLVDISALESSKPKNWEKKVQKKKELLARYEKERDEIKS